MRTSASIKAIGSTYAAFRIRRVLPNPSREDKNFALEFDPSNDLIERLTISKPLQESLEQLEIYFGGPVSGNKEKTYEFLFPKLRELSRLSSLHITPKILLKNSTLAYLPKTLVELSLDSVKLENSGLEENEGSDWKEAPLSRLPEGLEALKLSFSKDSSCSMDFKLFAYLPRRLRLLHIRTRNRLVCRTPKEFISSLPRRISDFRYASNCKGDPKDEPDHLAIALDEAIEEYYADPFWDGQRLTAASL